MWLARLCNNVISFKWRLKPVLVTGFIIWMGLYFYTIPHQTRIVKYVCEDDAASSGDIKEAAREAVDKPVDVYHDGVGNVTQNREGAAEMKGHSHSSYGHCQSEDFEHFGNVKKTSMTYFTSEFEVSEEPFRAWLLAKQTSCGGDVLVYGNMLGILRNVKINPQERKDAATLAKGGEGIQEVKSQNVQKEDYIFKSGFFEVECKASETQAQAAPGFNRYDRMSQLKMVGKFDVAENVITEEKFTIAITRGDYANLWNHMFELYGVFVLMMIFNKRPDEVNILFLDGHPSCLLDKNWEHIFGPVQRVGRFENPVLYKNLVWGLSDKEIPLSKWKNPTCPYVEEFRNFVLNQYDIVENAKKLNCKKLSFTFMVRRNQVYHPRNLEGNVQRKIFNELEVIEILMDKFPGVCIQALLMESIPMKAQMEIISETDVLIGMHGAGMMHTTFLPQHAGVVELFPREWRKTRPFSVMYEAMSLKWRKIKYGYWQNPDKERDFSETVTIVDVDRVYSEVKGVVDKMCNS